jgi:hypothetical protein
MHAALVHASRSTSDALPSYMPCAYTVFVSDILHNTVYLLVLTGSLTVRGGDRSSVQLKTNCLSGSQGRMILH